ncbi:hypothetical protein D9M71_364310 [compost metagenome]
MTVQLDAVHRRVGLHVAEDDIQPAARRAIEVGAASGKAELRQPRLIEIHRQHLRRARLELPIARREAHWQQTHQQVITFRRAMTHLRTAPLQQPAEQTSRLLLTATQRYFTAAHRHLAEIDIALPRPPCRRRRQQAGVTASETGLLGLQAKGRPLTGTPDEFSHAEIGHVLGEPALELIALHLPLGAFQARLEGQPGSRQACAKNEQED